MGKPKTDLSDKKISKFFRRNHLKLSVFLSYLRRNKTADSDIDILLEFDHNRIPGLIRPVRMENVLSSVQGCSADMRTVEAFSRYFKQEVFESADVKYATR